VPVLPEGVGPGRAGGRPDEAAHQRAHAVQLTIAHTVTFRVVIRP
jgi:hypothetical protein